MCIFSSITWHRILVLEIVCCCCAAIDCESLPYPILGTFWLATLGIGQHCAYSYSLSVSVRCIPTFYSLSLYVSCTPYCTSSKRSSVSVCCCAWGWGTTWRVVLQPRVVAFRSVRQEGTRRILTSCCRTIEALLPSRLKSDSIAQLLTLLTAMKASFVRIVGTCGAQQEGAHVVRLAERRARLWWFGHGDDGRTDPSKLLAK